MTEHGSAEMFSLGNDTARKRYAAVLKGTPLRHRLRQRAMFMAVGLAVRLGFPFGGVTISHHSPLGYGQVHKGGATSIRLVWRGRTYEGFLVPEDPRT